MHDLLRNIFEFTKGLLLIIHDNLCFFSYIFSSNNSSFLKSDILFDFLNLLNTKFKLFIFITIFSPTYSFSSLISLLFGELLLFSSPSNW